VRIRKIAEENFPLAARWSGDQRDLCSRWSPECEACL